MSSQCGCRNTESVMTLHSQRYFAMEGISEEQNGTTIAETSIRIAAFYLTDRTGEIKAKKTKARSPVLVEQSSPVTIAKYEMPYIQKET